MSLSSFLCFCESVCAVFSLACVYMCMCLRVFECMVLCKGECLSMSESVSVRVTDNEIVIVRVSV